MNNYKSYKCGALKSPKDDRDYKLNNLIMKAINLPNKYTVPVPAIIANQGDVGCCVASSLAQIKHCQEYKENGDTNMFSAAYIYANREDSDFQGSGMYPREALKNLVKNGTCYQEDFPGYNLYEYDEIKEFYHDNSINLDNLAIPYRASSYYRLNNLDDIKLALYTVGYVNVCYDVYKCLYYPDENGFINYKKIHGKSYGGHAMTACAYDDEKGCLGVINSWGKEYGTGINGISDGGCVWIPYEYKPSEAWACLDAPTIKQITKEYGEN